MESVGIYEARTRFAELAARANGGETILVTRNGTPFAELRPVSRKVDLDSLVDEILSRDWELGPGPTIEETIREARDERG
ncbi:MAG: type II toxin-antitoxin system prevent-host-death family antitoxin [Candidatus Eremiobacteraeota bacterium]|nr:type II toxin-antitoxin system prevent-host-death family antitoxin [Candidatus Eremiobacteraeota bacterium]